MPPPERVGSVKKEKKKPKTADLVKPHVEGVYLKKKTPEESKGDSQKKPSSEAKMKGEASSDDEAKVCYFLYATCSIYSGLANHASFDVDPQ